MGIKGICSLKPCPNSRVTKTKQKNEKRREPQFRFRGSSYETAAGGGTRGSFIILSIGLSVGLAANLGLVYYYIPCAVLNIYPAISYSSVRRDCPARVLRGGKVLLAWSWNNKVLRRYNVYNDITRKRTQ